MRPVDNEYEWSGSLAEVPLTAVLERCHALHVSGRLHLERATEAKVLEMWAGELDAPPSAGEWATGRFRIEQALPDVTGELIQGRELRGALAEVPPRMLLQHCQTQRLSAALSLERASGEQAVVHFVHGRVERATAGEITAVGGALAVLDGWNDGRFSLVLRPLFAPGTPLPAPPPSQPTLNVPGFDVTGGVAMPELGQVDAAALAMMTGAALPRPARVVSSALEAAYQERRKRWRGMILLVLVLATLGVLAAQLR